MLETTISASKDRDDDGRPVVTATDPESVAPLDWDSIVPMTEEELLADALTDPDTVILTPEQRKRLRRRPNPRLIRDRLGLTQAEFSERFEIPVGTLRDWEQGRRSPDAPARALLRVIEAEPELVARTLAPPAVAPDEAAED